MGLGRRARGALQHGLRLVYAQRWQLRGRASTEFPGDRAAGTGTHKGPIQSMDSSLWQRPPEARPRRRGEPQAAGSLEKAVAK